MKNLKRVLSLGLASVMLLGMMVVGASAKDFTDAEDIVHDEAVQVMVALKIIAGKEDGSYFAPKDNVTRGEMAKMIAVMMNGGSEANTGVKTNPSFTDIGGHWAEGWIEYCADMKIINGRGDGTFDPNGNVTGTEALKMVLTAMGYDAEAYHLQGASWASQTLERARKTGNMKLTEGLDDVVMTQPATRDVAAQMIWNGLQAWVVTTAPDQNTNSGEVTWKWTEKTGTTLLKQRYDANVVTGIYGGNYYYGGNGALKGEITVNVSGYTDDDTKVFNGAHTFPSDMSIDNIGEEVKVVWKDNVRGTKNKADKEDTIFGVFNTGATRVIRSQLSKINDQKTKNAQISIDGTLYDVVEDTPAVKDEHGNVVTAAHGNVRVITNYTQVDTERAENGYTFEESGAAKKASNSNLTKLLKKNSGTKFKAVFNTDGKIYKIYVTETLLAAVTGVNSEYINLNNNVGNLKISDNDIEEGLERGDVVEVTLLYGSSYGASKTVTTVKKAEKVSGELTAFKSNKDDDSNISNNKMEDESVTVGGKTYKINYKNLDLNDLDKKNLFYTNTSSPKLLTSIPDEDGTVIANFGSTQIDNDYIGEDFDLYLINGYVAAAVQTSEAARNYSVITEVKPDASAGGTFGALQLQVMGGDGTKEIITVSKDSVVWDKDKPAGQENLGHDNTRTDDSEPTYKDYWIGDIITYTFDKDDNAKVTIRGSAVKSGSVDYNEKSKTVLYGSKEYPTTGDCLFFTNTKAGATYDEVKIAKAKWEAYDIRDLDEIEATGAVSVALNKEGDRAVAVFANLMSTPDGAADDTVYGIVAKYNGRQSKDYYSYTIQANGEEYEVSYSGPTKTSADLAKGTLVKFRPNATNVYEKDDIVAVTSLAYSDTNNLRYLSGYSKELADNVLVYYGKVKLEGGSYVPDVDVDGVKTHSYALDKDAQIIYVNQDKDTSEAEGSVSEFNSLIDVKNIGFVTKKTNNDNGHAREVIVALFVETSGYKTVHDNT